MAVILTYLHSISRSRKLHAAGKLHGCVFYRTGVMADRK